MGGLIKKIFGSAPPELSVAALAMMAKPCSIHNILYTNPKVVTVMYPGSYILIFCRYTGFALHGCSTKLMRLKERMPHHNQPFDSVLSSSLVRLSSRTLIVSNF